MFGAVKPAVHRKRAGGDCSVWLLGVVKPAVHRKRARGDRSVWLFGVVKPYVHRKTASGDCSVWLFERDPLPSRKKGATEHGLRAAADRPGVPA